MRSQMIFSQADRHLIKEETELNILNVYGQAFRGMPKFR